MLTEAWTPLRYHPKQAALWRERKRFALVVAGRGSGKTELARRRTIRYLPVRKPNPNRPGQFYSETKYAYLLPTYNQAKRVAWRELKKLIPKEWLAKDPNESELYIETVFGSTLYVAGMDKPQRIEGIQLDGVVVDESSDHKPETWPLTIMPMLTHRYAWAWRVGVPKRNGVGAAEFKTDFDAAMTGSDPDTAAYTWPSADILTPEQLDVMRRTMTQADFDEQFGGLWQGQEGLIFYAFSDDNISTEAKYDDTKPIFVGSDFNVNPMCWSLAHRHGNDMLHVFDEIELRDTNTINTLNYLHERYGQHNKGWIFHGDASGKSRKTSAAASDYVQILEDDRFRPKKVHYLESNPLLVNRFAACNGRLCNAKGDINVLINPKCERLIKDLRFRQWHPDRREPNDSGDMGHMSDAFGYMIWYNWPLQMPTSGSRSVVLGGRR